MNIAHDQKTCFPGHPQGRADNAQTEFGLPLDWQDLRTRLFAANEVRAVLNADVRPLRLRLRGSFDGCAASVLTTYEGLSKGVNPTASTYFKPGEDIVAPVAGPIITGGRG